MTYGDLSTEEHGITFFYSVKPYEETATESYRPEIAVVKAFCHFFVERIPERALPELVASMTRIYEFHREDTPTRFALAAPSRQTRAKVGRKYERPPFEMPDE